MTDGKDVLFRSASAIVSGDNEYLRPCFRSRRERKPTRELGPGGDHKQRQHLLVSLAMVRVNYDAGRSYLDCFMPFVASAVCHMEASTFTLQEAQRAVLDRYALDVPQGVVKHALKAPGLSKTVSLSHGRYHFDAACAADYDLDRERQRALQEQSALVQDLRTFARLHHDRRLSEEEAWQRLESYVADWSLAVARAMQPAANMKYSLSKASGDDYIVTAFVADLIRGNPTGFGYLETAVRGSMVASALYHPDVQSLAQRLDRVTVYLDGPLLVDALGYAPEESESAVREMLELLYGLGARLACFDRTVDEVRGVLNSAKASLSASRTAAPRSGSAYEHFLRAGYRPSDVELALSRLEANIDALSVHIRPYPPRDEETQIDEAALEEAILSTVRYSRENAVKHDLNALAAMDRLRGGQHGAKLERCRAVFATKNTSLVRAGRAFFVGQGGTGCPPAVSHYDLAVLAWLKNPAKAPDLPRRQIIADCVAALRPSDRDWTRFLEEAGRLEAEGSIGSEDLAILRFDPDAERVFMSVTMGGASEIGETTVYDVLQEAKAVIRAPTLEAADAELTGAHAISQGEAQRADRADQTTRAVVDAMASDCAWRASRGARWVSRLLLGLPVYLVIAFALTCYALSQFGLQSVSPTVIGLGSAVAVILVAIAGVDYWLGGGIRIRTLVNSFELRLKAKLEVRNLRRLPEEVRKELRTL